MCCMLFSFSCLLRLPSLLKLYSFFSLFLSVLCHMSYNDSYSFFFLFSFLCLFSFFFLVTHPIEAILSHRTTNSVIGSCRTTIHLLFLCYMSKHKLIDQTIQIFIYSLPLPSICYHHLLQKKNINNNCLTHGV
jgi:hypothetical protein